METNNSPEHAILHAPEYAPIKENEQVLLSLGITADHIAALPIIVHTDDVFLLLEVRNRHTLQSLQPVPELIRPLSDQYHLAGYCIFCRDADKQADGIARIFTAFSPQPVGDPGTRAAGALACYLYDIAMIKKDVMVIFHDPSPDLPFACRITVHLHIHEGKILSLQSGMMEPV